MVWFDTTASADSDGTLSTYAWDFDDDTTDTTAGASPTHVYDVAGDYDVTLTVTDNDDGTSTTSRTVAPVAVRPIALVGNIANQGNVATPNTVVPAATSAGDRLLMVLSLSDATRVVGSTTGVTGWTLVDTETSGTMLTHVYTKIAVAGDAGRTTRFSMDAPAKYTLTVAAYSGDMLAPQVARASETVTRPGHTTPIVEAATGDWTVSYWADKTSSTTAFALPGGVTQRQAACASGGGRICSVFADSAGPVSAGAYGALTATADSSTPNATMWTVLLRQAS